MPEPRCRRCGNILTEENWPLYLSCLNNHLCKFCRRKDRREKYIETMLKAGLTPKPKFIQADILHPVCIYCGVILTEKNWRKSFSNHYYHACKECYFQRYEKSVKHYQGHKFIQEDPSHPLCRKCKIPLTDENWPEYLTGYLCTDCNNKQKKRWYIKHPEYNMLAMREYKSRAFHIIADYWHGSADKCFICGETEKEGLPFIIYGQIDHINGGGRQEYLTKSALTLYRDIISGKRTMEDFQLLCPTCNRIKQFENKEYYSPPNLKSTPEKREYWHKKKLEYKIRAFQTIADYHGKSPDRCWRCMETEHAGHPFIDYGQKDHVNGGGDKELKFYGSNMNNLIFYGEVSPAVYQLLCPTCNFIKRYENKEYGNLYIGLAAIVAQCPSAEDVKK